MQTKEHEMRCLSEGYCQCQRILKLLTLRVIIVDRVKLHSPLMTERLSPVHHVCTQTNMHTISLFLYQIHTHAQSLSSVCHYLLPSVIMLMWLHYISHLAQWEQPVREIERGAAENVSLSLRDWRFLTGEAANISRRRERAATVWEV